MHLAQLPYNVHRGDDPNLQGMMIPIFTMETVTAVILLDPLSLNLQKMALTTTTVREHKGKKGMSARIILRLRLRTRGVEKAKQFERPELS